jgi:short-subunit dehydrogenase
MRLVITLCLLASYVCVHSQNNADSTAQKTFSIRNSNPFAVIAGGSKGIGYAIAEALAKRSYNLVLIARHEGPLKNAKEKLEKAYNIQVEILMHDLSLEKSAEEIANWCKEKNLPVKMLANVAGLGGGRDYLQLTLDSLRYMVRLNVESGMALTLSMLPLLEANAPAYVLNVSSMAGFAPIPTKNMYSATKSAVMHFSYALRYQLKPKRISVSCLAPGPVFTKPQIREETKRTLGWLGMQMAVPPARVGEIAVRKTLKRKMLIIPGTLTKLSSVVIRILPKRMAARIYNGVGKKG